MVTFIHIIHNGSEITLVWGIGSKPKTQNPEQPF